MSKIDEIAKQFSDAVRDAFIRVYGDPLDPNSLNTFRPSWSEKGIKTGWHEPDPGVVLVFTEYGWVPDPYRSPEDRKLWEAAMDLLQKAGWDRVRFESINPGVQIIYWTPPAEWQKILNQQAKNR